MRRARQKEIIDIINSNDIETQEMLGQLLESAGYGATQATISRDIKELNLIKNITASGKYCYQVQGHTWAPPITDRFKTVFKETIQEIDFAENLIVIKTLSGCAAGAAEAIDTTKFDGIVGSVAGDNTILLIARSKDHVPAIMKQFKKMME